MTNQELHALLEYFGQEQACYTSLLDLSRKQEQYIENKEIDELLSVLSEKQKILLKLEKIERDLLPYKQEWQTVREGLDENDRQVLDIALSTVEELLSELIDLEKKSEKLLAECREETHRQLDDVIKGNSVHRAYVGGRREPSSKYFDILE